MPKPIVELLQSTTADIRAGRETWRVMTLLCTFATVIALVVQHIR
jgi:hypothetical protein